MPGDLLFEQLSVQKTLPPLNSFIVRGVTKDHVTCSTTNLSPTIILVPKIWRPFLLLLQCLNFELTEASQDKRNDIIYWKSLRLYLNTLIDRTLEDFDSGRSPMALSHWLQRELMLCRHDNNGRQEYLDVVISNGLQPYDMDVFAFGWCH
jgi:hypothetical protein